MKNKKNCFRLLRKQWKRIPHASTPDYSFFIKGRFGCKLWETGRMTFESASTSACLIQWKLTKRGWKKVKEAHMPRQKAYAECFHLIQDTDINTHYTVQSG